MCSILRFLFVSSMIDAMQKENEEQDGRRINMGMFFDLVRQLKAENGKQYVESKLQVNTATQH